MGSHCEPAWRRIWTHCRTVGCHRASDVLAFRTKGQWQSSKTFFSNIIIILLVFPIIFLLVHRLEPSGAELVELRVWGEEFGEGTTVLYREKGNNSKEPNVAFGTPWPFKDTCLDSLTCVHVWLRQTAATHKHTHTFTNNSTSEKTVKFAALQQHRATLFLSFVPFIINRQVFFGHIVFYFQ